MNKFKGMFYFFMIMILAAGCGSKQNNPAPTPAGTAKFIPLSFSNDFFHHAVALAISDDGKTVAGSCIDENVNLQPVLWSTVDGSVTRLPFMHNIPAPGFSYNAWVNGISNNGVLVGNQQEIDLNPKSSFYKNGDWNYIIDPATTGFATTAKAVSGNGDTVVGRILDPGGDCSNPPCIGGYFYRISTGEFAIIPSTFTVDKPDCDALGVDCHIDFYALTGNGLIAAGTDNYFGNSSPEKPWINAWPKGNNAKALGAGEILLQPVIYNLRGQGSPVRLPLPDNYLNGEIRGISKDGSAVAGGADDPSKPTIAVWWDSNSSPHIIGSLNGPDTEHHDTMAYAAANGGTRIVGISQGLAFIYEPATGIQPLQDYLKNRGLGKQLQGWTLTSAYAITPDGHYIVGNGKIPGNYQQGFVAYIP